MEDTKEISINSRVMTIEDFASMSTEQLLGWWIFDQEATMIEKPTQEQCIAMMASYDAYGREGVASILAERGYVTENDPVKMISLPAAKGMLSKMKNEDNYSTFYVEFIKRSTGELRKMRCRFGVKKHLKGGTQNYEPREHDLLSVWDFDAEPRFNKEEQEQIKAGKLEPRKSGDYRSINLTDLIRISMQGRKYVVEENIHLVPKLP
jgi:hypothetical protein